ncbi:hypothetical protein BGX20_001129, partial [Mortierella sp. AD010]
MASFTAAITVAFLIEAFPRKNTKVQRLVREKEDQSDYEQANLFSRLSIQYFQQIVSIGATRPLTGDDLTNTTPKHILTNVNYERLAIYWDQEKERCIAEDDQPSYFWTVLRAYKKEIYIAMLIQLVGYGMIYIPPTLFGQLLWFIDDYSEAHREGTEPPALRIGFAISTLMLIFNIMSIVALANSFQLLTNIGIQARAATVALIYRKSLRLSPQARQSFALGGITNCVAMDAEKWIDAAVYLPYVVTVPFELAISIYLLYQLLGWCLFVGLAVFGILVPIQTRTTKFMNGFQKDQFTWMDSRLRLTTELLSNIKIIKLYNWEIPLRKRIDDFRNKELKELKSLATIQSIRTTAFSSVTLLMGLFAFWAFAYYGGPNMTRGKLNSEVIFVSITLFGVMNRPLGLVAHTISKTIGTRVAMRRIKRFLLLEEIDSTVTRRYSRQPQSSAPGKEKKPLAVDIENGTFMWEKRVDPVVDTENVIMNGEHRPLLTYATPKPIKLALSNITLHVPEGNLTAIVGRVGQGKSSFLSAIMGEMYQNQEGTVTVYGDIAYVPQQAWIINAT